MIYIKKFAVLLAIAAVQFGAMAADPVVRTPLAGSNFPIAAAVTVTAGTGLVFLSGATASVADSAAPAGTIAAYGNTETQALSVLKSLAAAYTQFFGTKDQPNLPARTTVQVAALGNPGLLVEIDAVAARSH